MFSKILKLSGTRIGILKRKKREIYLSNNSTITSQLYLKRKLNNKMPSKDFTTLFVMDYFLSSEIHWLFFPSFLRDYYIGWHKGLKSGKRAGDGVCTPIHLFLNIWWRCVTDGVGQKCGGVPYCINRWFRRVLGEMGSNKLRNSFTGKFV